jgi:hypothetical protein
MSYVKISEVSKTEYKKIFEEYGYASGNIYPWHDLIGETNGVKYLRVSYRGEHVLDILAFARTPEILMELYYRCPVYNQKNIGRIRGADQLKTRAEIWGAVSKYIKSNDLNISYHIRNFDNLDLRPYMWSNFFVKIKYTALSKIKNHYEAMRPVRRQEVGYAKSRENLRIGGIHSDSAKKKLKTFLRENLKELKSSEYVVHDETIDFIAELEGASFVCCENNLGEIAALALLLKPGDKYMYLAYIHSRKNFKYATACLQSHLINLCASENLQLDTLGANSPKLADAKASYGLIPNAYFEITSHGR